MEQWETLKTIRQEQAEWQKPSDDLYTRVDRKHWEKLVDTGFRIMTDCYHRPAVQFFMDHSLFTHEESEPNCHQCRKQRVPGPGSRRFI